MESTIVREFLKWWVCIDCQHPNTLKYFNSLLTILPSDLRWVKLINWQVWLVIGEVMRMGSQKGGYLGFVVF